MVRSGEADLGLCSVVDAAGEAADLALLPVGMIGCDGPTMTVRLYSAVPLEGVTVLHADTDSHTSVVLCRVLLHRLFGIRPRLVDFDARERVSIGTQDPVRGSQMCRGATQDMCLDAAWPETVLLIGDKVVTDAPPADRYPHQLDLGEAWHGLTGLPFVYATWMCRADRADDTAILAGAALLDRQRRRNAVRLDWLIAKHAPLHRWPLQTAARYLGELLRYEVGPREREAVERFLTDAAGLGLLPGARVVWADEPAATPL
jgi:chorismate dehydratase